MAAPAFITGCLPDVFLAIIYCNFIQHDTAHSASERPSNEGRAETYKVWLCQSWHAGLF
jgi:hypothetical protein